MGWEIGGGNSSGSAICGVDNFNSAIGTQIYTRPLLNGKTIVMVQYGTQTLEFGTQWNFVSQFELLFVPDEIVNINVFFK